MVADGLTSVTPDGDVLRVREVWADNLDEEMALIRDVVERHPFVAMDTEFPGVVARPVGNFRNSGEYHYQTLRCNVDMLKLIQLGLTFTDAQGRLPRVGGELAVWQVNFREFRLGDDMYAQDSIDLLKTSGIDFRRMEDRGCDVHRFGELLMTSGVVLSDEVHWVTFHSGYDFGYLLKLLTCAPLPPTEQGFFELLGLYFPALYDIKYLMKFCGSLHGGLNKLAETLEVERIGPQHQAGSDSLLTAATFLKLAATFFSSDSSKGGKGGGKGGKSDGGCSGSEDGDGDGNGDGGGKGGGKGDKSGGSSSSSNGNAGGRSAGTGGLGHESKGAAGGGGAAQTAENVLAGLEEHRGILYGLGSDGTNEAPQD